METLIVTSLITTAVVSFLIGKYSERIAWNKLIQHGILPKPINPKK